MREPWAGGKKISTELPASVGKLSKCSLERLAAGERRLLLAEIEKGGGGPAPPAADSATRLLLDPPQKPVSRFA